MTFHISYDMNSDRREKKTNDSINTKVRQQHTRGAKCEQRNHPKKKSKISVCCYQHTCACRSFLSHCVKCTLQARKQISKCTVLQT